MDWQAIRLTLKLAICTSVILFFIGLPIAWWTARTRCRVKFLVEALVAMPIILPPTVIGFYVLFALGPFSPVGQAYERLTGHRLVFSFAGILIASVFYNLPFAVRPFAAAFASVDQLLIEAARCLGASRFQTFWRIVFPMSWPGIWGGIMLTFAHTVGEFGVVLMVGANIPGTTRTIAISIFDDVQAMNYGAAHRTAALLVGFAFALLCGTSVLQRRIFPI